MEFNDSLSIGMDDFSSNEDVQIPEVLPMMAVRDVVVFNYMIIPLFVGRPGSVEAVNEALAAEVEEADLVEAYELLADLKRRQVMLGGVVEEEEAVEATSVLMRLPADVKAGGVLSATLPDGTRLTFTAPEDAYPGMLVDASTGMEVEGVVMPTRILHATPQPIVSLSTKRLSSFAANF